MHEINDFTIRDSITTVSRIHLELGIPLGYRVSCGMNLQEECTNLVNTELDVFGRQPQLEVATFAAWQTMQAAAIKDDIVLQIISAYRSYDYQKEMFIRKLARGDSLSAILQVNAAPGYSEHHSGRAVDIGCPGYPYLEVNFETSPAFAWLSVRAEKFGFHMSFPKENNFGVCYEPWHWCFINQA